MTLTRRRPCAAPPPPAEPDMFGPVQQPRTKAKETKAVYGAVLALRRAGVAVTRVGRGDHKIDGRAVSHATLKVLAESVHVDHGSAGGAGGAAALEAPSAAPEGINQKASENTPVHTISRPKEIIPDFDPVRDLPPFLDRRTPRAQSSEAAA